MTASREPINNYFKVVVILERRSDGGLRAYSDDVPGFVLSHSNPLSVLADIKPALEGILSHMFEGGVVVKELASLRERITQTDTAGELPLSTPTREYVTHRLSA
jgi:hypothetical protein